MLLQSSHTAFNLDVIGYEDPLGGSTHEDRNLLLICLRVADTGRCWQTIAPLLHTYEVQHIADWFTDILADREVPDQLGFLEPCLAFKLSEVSPGRDRFCFQVTLRYEAVPPWWNEPLHKPYLLPIDCKRAALQHAVSYLAGQTAAYCVR